MRRRPLLDEADQQEDADHRERERELRSIYIDTIHVLAGVIDGVHSPGEPGHSARVAALAAETARQLGMKRESCERLYVAGLLHDIGKQFIQQEVLKKNLPLNQEEVDAVRRHPEIAYDLISHIRFPWGDVAEIVRHHHERLDGSGYPDGLEGERISLLAQIIGLVDTFDALTTVRPYKPAFSRESAYDELRKETQRGWRRRDLIEEFIALERSGQLQSQFEVFWESSTQTVFPWREC